MDLTPDFHVLDNKVKTKQFFPCHNIQVHSTFILLSTDEQNYSYVLTLIE